VGMTPRPDPVTSQPGRRQVLRWIGGVMGAIGVGAAARLFNPSRSGTPATTRVEAAPATTTSTNQSPVIAAGGGSSVAIISKTGWGAKPAGPLGSHTPVRVTYHHSAEAGAKVGSAPARIRGYQAYHLDQGWPDIAYHFLIDQAGRIYQGRDPDAPGDTFTEYDPTGHFLICFDGNFDSESAPAETVEALVKMLAWGCQRYGIDPATLGAHRDYAATTCPGKNLYALKATIGQRLGEALASGTQYQLVFSDTPV
jgi:N-acetylmuramoyl-L-alanine amidase